MSKIFLTVSVIVLFSVTSCNNSAKENASANEGKKESKIDLKEKMISWDDMVVEINKAEYATLGQSHELIITLVMPDGTSLKAKEPSIDAFIEIVRKCEKCKELPIVTE